MPRVTLDATTCAKLGDLNQYLELCDESGRTVGYFTPAEDVLRSQQLSPRIDDEELRRRDLEEGGRALQEILADLESRG